MGTLFFTDEMMPAAHPHEGKCRQVEVFRPSGLFHLELRIGELDEQHRGSGSAVIMNEKDARDLLAGLIDGMHYLNYRYDDIVGSTEKRWALRSD